jgi:two-component system, chemotaxis family, protein-glutamate methylesterase/glutaminase
MKKGEYRISNKEPQNVEGKGKGMNKIIRVLVVDDSAFVRKVVKEMLLRSPFMEVVGTARDGEEALEMVEALNPDVVTLDLIMPVLDGVGFLRKQMARRPIPVVVASIASETGEGALNALDAGAVDFVQKPTALSTEKIFEIADDLIAKVKAAADVSISRVKVHPPPEAVPSIPVSAHVRAERVDAVVIGISTGGPPALKSVIPQLPENFPLPMAIVLHMPEGFTQLYAEQLDRVSHLRVKEVEEGDEFVPGTVLLARAGRHLKFKRETDGRVLAYLDARPFDTPHRPSVNVLFESAANIFHDRVLGVVMTGMGSDGKEGAAWIKSQGGLIITEAEETCVVYGMPRSVVEANLSDKVAPLYDMARVIVETI